uniref:Thioredoxin domain-containing protein n=1 Tax=Oncorhynchus mykiss TaxID=8022 RepID=A0A8C7ST57_ONCMY
HPPVLTWGVLFSHPQDFTPVCTTELACAAKISFEFKKRNVKMIALSIDSVADHLAWSKDVMPFNSESGCSPLPFPIIADDEGALFSWACWTLMRLTRMAYVKGNISLLKKMKVFVVGPDKMKLSIMYPATTGRNFDELLRVIDSLQLTALEKLATPVDWKINTKYFDQGVTEPPP